MTNQKFLLRTPLLRFDNLVHDEAGLWAFYKNPAVREALFIASKALFAELENMENGLIKDAAKKEKLLVSLYKYHTRMCTRCTPFGFFSGIATGDLAHTTVFPAAYQQEPRVRLDTGFLCALYQALMEDASFYRQLTFFPNNTLYRIDDEWRYIEYRFMAAYRIHDLVSVEHNAVLEQVLTVARGGVTLAAISHLLQQDGYETDEIEPYLAELVRSQVLVPDLYPSVTGTDYHDRLLPALAHLNSDKYPGIGAALLDIFGSAGDLMVKTTRLEALCQQLQLPIDTKNLIQADVYLRPDQCTVATTVLDDIRSAQHFLARLHPSSTGTSLLEKFKRAFWERYEDAFLPLAEVMDTDMGIGYKNAVSISGQTSRPDPRESELQQFRMQLYKRSLINHQQQVTITPEDMAGFDHWPTPEMPASCAFLGQILQHRDGGQRIRFKAACGASAIDLVGRFGHLNQQVADICTHIARAEQAHYPSAIVAEIAHLPDGRLGNVTSRPHYRQYEIPYLAHSCLPAGQQILVEDLYVGVVDFKVVLYSKKHGCEIIPRLSNAHNFRYDSLPVYHFLCDLQSQHTNNDMYWSWGDLSNEPFLPRVTCQNTILSPARWNLKTAALKNNHPADRLDHFLTEHQLPEVFVIVQADNELYIDTRNELGRTTFIKFCNKYDSLQIDEFLFHDPDFTNQQANEVIVPLIQPVPAGAARTTPSWAPFMGTQTFSPLSQWVYFKIYTGKKFTEKILTALLPGLLNQLAQNNLTDQWFFVRYADPKTHLRLRFHLSDIRRKNELLDICREYFEPYTREGQIWDLQMATYRQEVNRYGEKSMGCCETWFYRNSELVLQLLPGLPRFSEKKLAVLLLYYTDKLLDQLGWDMDQKNIFVRQQSALYNKEFGVDTDKPLRLSLDTGFRDIRPEMGLLDGVHGENLPDTEAAFFRAVQENRLKTNDLIDALVAMYPDQPYFLQGIAASFIHLFFNRLFVTNQRFQEMKIYYFLCKHYQSCLRRKQPLQNISNHEQHQFSPV